jgi:hypothetical protein
MGAPPQPRWLVRFGEGESPAAAVFTTTISIVAFGRFKRHVLRSVVIPFAVVSSCTALLIPATRLVDRMTHFPLVDSDTDFYPILIVQGGQPRVLMLQDFHAIPPPPGATNADAGFSMVFGGLAPVANLALWGIGYFVYFLFTSHRRRATLL